MSRTNFIHVIWSLQSEGLRMIQLWFFLSSLVSWIAQQVLGQILARALSEISFESKDIKCVFGLELANLLLDKLDFIKLILVRSEFEMKWFIFG